MASIKGTETEKNLLTAFAGESQARNRYNYFAKVAKEEGYVSVYQYFEKIANQEKEHAKRLFKFLEGGEVEITASYPAGVIHDKTYDNLKDAAAGEEYEYQTMYPQMADVAEQEGFSEIAAVLRSIAIAEEHHAEIFNSFAEQIEKDMMFHREVQVTWECINCGYIYVGDEPPFVCPACAHPQSYFKIKSVDYILVQD